MSEDLKRLIEIISDPALNNSVRLGILLALYSVKSINFTQLLRVVEIPKSSLYTHLQVLEEAGYVYIGMDHFAKPDDELARAQRAGKLHRNFQGYSTQAELDLLAFGVSSISNVGNCYAQNAKTIDEYTEMLAFDKLPTARGVHLTPEDHLRRAAIQRLMCDFHLDLHALSAEYGVDAKATFAADLQRLKPLEEAGLVTREGAEGLHVHVTPQGRLLVRVVAMQFDGYLHQPREQLLQPRYSRVI